MSLLKNYGEAKSIELISTFFKMNDQWFQKRRHSPDCLNQNINAVVVFAATGKAVTQKQARLTETLDNNARVMGQFLDGPS